MYSRNVSLHVSIYCCVVLFTASISTNPLKACVNDEVVVTCIKSISNPFHISYSYTGYIVGTSNTAISESDVDGAGYHGGVNLARLTATAPAYSSTTAQATITLLSYTSSDDGLRLGCSIRKLYHADGAFYDFVQTVNIQGAS